MGCWVTPPDCGDSSCYFAVGKGGMRTNGGCRCLSNAGFSKGIHASVRDMLLEILKLRAETSKLRTAQDILKQCIKAVSPTALVLIEVELAALEELQDFVKVRAASR